MEKPKREQTPRMVAIISDTFGLSTMMASFAAFFVVLVAVLAVVWFVKSAPPHTLTISSGRPGSSLERYAEAYKKILATHGIELKILPSGGSEENLERLLSEQPSVEVGFVQGGLSAGRNLDRLVSLGSVAYEPLWIFYRGQTEIGRLSQLQGERIAVGAVGSGSRALALTVLQPNGITGMPTVLLDVDAEKAAKGLKDGSIDAIFLTGDSAQSQTVRELLRSTDVHLFSFTQSDAYTRRFDFLNRIALPEGSIDLGRDMPSHEVTLIGPTVELVARKGLNSALSDLLIEVAREVHGKAGLLQRRGEFPAPIEHEFKLSDDAQRYYKSGRGFIYRAIGSFWLASLVNRLLVAFVPALLLIIPAVRFFPSAYRWTVQVRFFRCYRRLLRLDQEASAPLSAEQHKALIERLDEIEASVNALRVPAYLADQYYGLRGHITFVRDRLVSSAD